MNVLMHVAICLYFRSHPIKSHSLNSKCLARMIGPLRVFIKCKDVRYCTLKFRHLWDAWTAGGTSRVKDPIYILIDVGIGQPNVRWVFDVTDADNVANISLDWTDPFVLRSPLLQWQLHFKNHSLVRWFQQLASGQTPSVRQSAGHTQIRGTLSRWYLNSLLRGGSYYNIRKRTQW